MRWKDSNTMLLTWEQIADNAIVFSKRWADAKNERAEAQLFLHELLGVFGVDSKRVATFEKKIHPDTDLNGFIDLLWPGRILIEMKSRGKSLDRAYIQAKSYAFAIEHDNDLPEYIMVCDFERIRLYRLTTEQQWEFKVRELKKHIKKLSILTDHASKYNFIVDTELNTKAAYKMAELHDVLKENRYEGHALEMYLVRLLFCLFADDAGIFHKNAFHEYLDSSSLTGADLSGRLMDLFDVLNTPPKNRQPTLSPELLTYPYVNGGLFAETLRPAAFNEKMRRLLLECCNFDWSSISPSIFGSMFQGVMNPEERRALGAHYTSEQNILKVIKPLFLTDLYAEFERVKSNETQLEYFHNKLSKLTFLDPACGCGNFLIITYREIRLLELEVLKMQIDNYAQLQFGLVLADRIKVNVNQFYGIEYEEFPCRIAQVGLWLMDHLMNNLVIEHFGVPYVRLPLKESATIVTGNALQIDWNSVIQKQRLSFIIGNPPFVGYSMQSVDQKQDILSVCVDQKGLPLKSAGKIDYVAAWYFKAAKMMTDTVIQTAFVSTNSIVQGEQAAVIWEPLLCVFNVHIDFGYRTFFWSNEAKGKAAVHCVIVGFSIARNEKDRLIFDGDDIKKVLYITPYLTEGDAVFIAARSKPLCNVPILLNGGKPAEGGHLILTSAEKDELIAQEPLAEKYIRRFMMGKDFIDRKSRYCLWLVNAKPEDIRHCPIVRKRIEAVRDFRLASKKEATREKANTPSLFDEVRECYSKYIAIPVVSSERRKYIPIDYLPSDIIPGNKLFMLQDAGLYHFGILTSNVHNAWMRVVCGRLKSDYSYSNTIVYNNFPWPDPSDDLRQAIEEAAQAVLDARDSCPDSSLADLYDPLTMPPILAKAHSRLDKLVWKAYGADWKSEAECVADLMKRYKKLTKQA
jgi:hypothetical protein